MLKVIDLSKPIHSTAVKSGEKTNNRRMSSVDPDCKEDTDAPMPGDLVFATLKGIKHQVRITVFFSRNFIIVGAVVGFTNIDYAMVKVYKRGIPFDKYVKKEKLIIEWILIETGGKRFFQIIDRYRIR